MTFLCYLNTIKTTLQHSLEPYKGFILKTTIINIRVHTYIIWMVNSLPYVIADWVLRPTHLSKILLFLIFAFASSNQIQFFFIISVSSVLYSVLSSFNCVLSQKFFIDIYCPCFFSAWLLIIAINSSHSESLSSSSSWIECP